MGDRFPTNWALHNLISTQLTSSMTTEKDTVFSSVHTYLTLSLREREGGDRKRERESACVCWVCGCVCMYIVTHASFEENNKASAYQLHSKQSIFCLEWDLHIIVRVRMRVRERHTERNRGRQTMCILFLSGRTGESGRERESLIISTIRLAC